MSIQQMIFEPESGIVLAKLGASEFGDVPVPQKAHDSQTNGIVLAVADKDKEYLVGRRAYWQRYKDDVRIPNSDNLVFIKVEDILGTSRGE